MGVYRMLGRAIIRELTGLNWRTTDIIREVRKAGYGYRRDDMLKDIRDFEGRMKQQDRLRVMGRDKYVPKSYMHETDLRLDHKYRVHGTMQYRDLTTGELKTKRASFYTDEYQRLGDWEQDFVSYPWQEKYGQGYRVEGFQTLGVEHNYGYPY